MNVLLTPIKVKLVRVLLIEWMPSELFGFVNAFVEVAYDLVLILGCFDAEVEHRDRAGEVSKVLRFICEHLFIFRDLFGETAAHDILASPAQQSLTSWSLCIKRCLKGAIWSVSRVRRSN